jgi:hypothetical protein
MCYCVLQMAWLSQEQQRQAAAMQQQQLGVQAALQRSPWLGWTQPKAVIKGNSQVRDLLARNSMWYIRVWPEGIKARCMAVLCCSETMYSSVASKGTP